MSTRQFLLTLACAIVLASRGDSAQSVSSGAIACGDGRVSAILDNFDSPWTICCTADPRIPNPVLRSVSGCNGSAIAVDYDLTEIAPPDSSGTGQSWVVLQRFFPRNQDLTNYTHIRLSMRGSNIDSHETVEVKLKDAKGGLFTAALKSMTDLPVWRPTYIDLREFTGNGSIDLANIASLEIGITRCDACEVFDNPAVGRPARHSGTLFLDEFAVVDLKSLAVNRVVETGLETASANATARARAANAILARVASGPGTGLVPAWFPETGPNFNTYVQAEALLVFVNEYVRTSNVAFRDAARTLAQKSIALQIPAGRAQSGAWYTTYGIQGTGLVPPNRVTPDVACDGNEAMIADARSGKPVATNIDACEWAGNVGWMLIALSRLQRSGLYGDPVALQAAVDAGAAWILRQPSYRGVLDYPDLVTLGVEGNISAYFGLLAAGKKNEAAVLGNAIFRFAWDPAQRRMKSGVRPEDAASAMDVCGSWGVTFLRSIGRLQEALDSQGYAVSVLRVRSFDDSIQGYGDIAGPYTPAVEFAAQAVSAGIKDADFVLQQLYALQIPVGQPDAGAFPGARDHWYGGPLSPWVTTMAGVSPTAWVYFASSQDPLVDLVSAGTRP